ncbi:MAG TPA: NAD(P)-dependent oxidoreductase [Chloroflexota bacterium]|jgi:phosphoglycerate dehydrogenase-like enzyme|nr:NAD(P)-dependent oxidoreductase [Chloroflexota bacterium]
MDIVIPDDYPPTYASLEQPDLARLAPYGTVTLHTMRSADRAELFARLAPADVALNVRAYTTFDDEALSHAPRLKLISILGTGTDNVDLRAASARGITVTNTPGVGAPSVAELTLGLLLAVTRAIPLSDSRLRQGTWQHVEGPELAGKTLGLLGLGAIGQYVARLGHGLGMRVIAWSFRDDPARAAELGVQLVSRDDVFRQADVVSLHLRNTPEVRGLVGARELALMKASAFLINTSRGALVDEPALAAALRSSQLAGAGLDVYSEEPLPPERNVFRDLPNVVLTPHVGAVTREANTRSRAMPVDNIIAFLNGTPVNVVNAAKSAG